MLIVVFQDMMQALKTVSTFFTENNIHTRRNLRGEIERRSLLVNQQFVEAFSHVMKVIIFSLLSTCIEARVDKNHEFLKKIKISDFFLFKSDFFLYKSDFYVFFNLMCRGWPTSTGDF